MTDDERERTGMMTMMAVPALHNQSWRGKTEVEEEACYLLCDKESRGNGKINTQSLIRLNELLPVIF